MKTPMQNFIDIEDCGFYAEEYIEYPDGDPFYDIIGPDETAWVINITDVVLADDIAEMLDSLHSLGMSDGFRKRKSKTEKIYLDKSEDGWLVLGPEDVAIPCWIDGPEDLKYILETAQGAYTIGFERGQNCHKT